MHKSVETITTNNRLIETMQQNKTRFALAGFDEKANKVLQCHQFVHCRDFMLDAFVALENESDVNVYNFTYGKTNPRPWKDGVSVLLQMPNMGALKKFQDNFPLLKDIESYMNWEVSLPDLVDYPDQKVPVVWMIGDPKWCKTAISFSLYTYLLKCLTFDIPDKDKWKEAILSSKTNEGEYMDIPYLNWLLTHLDEITAKYENFSGFKDQHLRDVYDLHDFMGFVSLKDLIWKKSKYSSSHYNSHVLNGYHAEEEKCAA